MMNDPLAHSLFAVLDIPRGDPVIQLSPPLIVGQKEFDDIEAILRTVLTEAWTKL